LAFEMPFCLSSCILACEWPFWFSSCLLGFRVAFCRYCSMDNADET
jgi:hypothetical protein